jgi:MFS family permease
MIFGLGRKAVLVLCTRGWELMSLLTGLAHSFVSLFVFRFLTVVGKGPISAMTDPSFLPTHRKRRGDWVKGFHLFIGNAGF